MIEIAEEMIKDKDEVKIDLTEFKKYFKPFLDIASSYLPENDTQRENAIQTLFEMHDITLADEQILESTIYELSKFDKLYELNDFEIPYLLNQLIEVINIYQELIYYWELTKREAHTINQTIAHTSSNSPKKMLTPLNPYLKPSVMIDEEQRQVYQNVYDDFQEDPYITNIALASALLIHPKNFHGIDQKKIDALYHAAEFLVSNGTVEKKDIIKSLRIQISLFYLKDKFYQNELKLKKYISKEKLAEHIDVILQHLFDVKAKTIVKKLGSPIQERTRYGIVVLYEYTRKGKEKVHPVLQDTEYLQTMTEKIKGKIPEKQSV